MTYPFVPLRFERLPVEESRQRGLRFLAELRRRRTVREFAPDPVALDLVDTAIETAGSAPSGANRQPWKFVVIADAATKLRIREAAEKEERDFYERRATPEWLQDLAPLGTGWQKEFLETAPYLIAVFRIDYEPALFPDGTEHKHKNYYVQESVGIAVGFLLAALHVAGLATLTHTPSPMQFLREVLGRPKHEQPYMLIAIGYPAVGATVPDIGKKSLDEIRELVGQS
ncbi:MAG: nitroreductase family protein [Acidobacteriota bacterium]|nr:nitroreductase family protein [Acidobacteriota bacterium]